jgi:methyl-accepting chemotaxis protein
MSTSVYDVVKRVSDAMVEGNLDVRGDSAGLMGKDAETVELVNRMIDALIVPIRLAGNALDEIANGELPQFVIDDHKGEFSKIKQSINTLLAILYGIHGETEHLISSVSLGKLKTRGNDWDYKGIWKKLIHGINSAMDAVIAPINEAGTVLERLACYDLNARMRGKYRGEHAAIRKTMNATAESLHEAISQVSETVGLVSNVGSQITRISAIATKGAEEQSVQLNETSMSLATLSESASESAKSTAEAHENAKRATDSILKAKESMAPMVVSMHEIGKAAEKTSAIAHEIDTIAKETGTLADSAVEKAEKMRISAAGFGVVAHEVAELSKKCSEAAQAMKDFEAQLEAEQKKAFASMITCQLNIAHFSNLLGVNAAIEAAHIQGTGKSFKGMTDEIHRMAVRSAEAAGKTGTLTESLSSLSQNGIQQSREIDSHLEDAVNGSHALSTFSDNIYTTILAQTAGLQQISMTASQISEVTDKNAEGAVETLVAAKNLEGQVEKLSRMVNRFSF